MTRRDLLPLALAALLTAVPILPTMGAEDSPPSALVAVLCDDFGQSAVCPALASPGCPTPPGTSWTPTPSGTQSWFRVDNGTVPVGGSNVPRATWFASRMEGGQPAGYGNGANVILRSSAIQMPTCVADLRSVSVTLRGSSHDGDFLRLQWAPSPTAPEAAWETLEEWSGYDLAKSYSLTDQTSIAFLRHHGSFALRFVFASDATCDSDPGSEQPDPTVPQAGEAVDPARCPLTDPVETEEPPTPVTALGWFVDRVVVFGRRDYVAEADSPLEPITVDASGADVSVDLLTHRGRLLDFTVSDDVGGSVQSTAMQVHLHRQATGEVLTIAGSRNATGWSALLAVDEPDLVAGTWTASYFGMHAGGAILLGTRTLTVTAQDNVAPLLKVTPSGDPVRLGPGDTLLVGVTESYLRRVTYSYPGLPVPHELPFPYVLPSEAFPEGVSDLTVTATDRTGHTSQANLKVDRDSLLPEVSLTAPSTVYAGVPFDLGLNVTERSAHTIRLDANGTLLTFEVPAGFATLGKLTRLQLTAPDLGNMTVQVLVNDTMGNEAVLVRQFTAVEPVTDLQVSGVRLTSPITGISREGHVITAVIEQKDGVAPLPVTVAFEGAGRAAAFNVTVPASGPFEVVWNVTLPPGIHEVRVTAVGPAIANETAPGDEQGSLMVESFLGRVTVGSKVYNIRADTRGLPAQVVLSGTSKTFPLSLIDSDRGVAYRFVAEGNRTIVWDPLVPVQVVPESSGPTSDPGDKGAPAPGIALALLVVALAALAQRRARSGR